MEIKPRSLLIAWNRLQAVKIIAPPRRNNNVCSVLVSVHVSNVIWLFVDGEQTELLYRHKHIVQLSNL